MYPGPQHRRVAEMLTLTGYAIGSAHVARLDVPGFEPSYRVVYVTPDRGDGVAQWDEDPMRHDTIQEALDYIRAVDEDIANGLRYSPPRSLVE
jgi:hypothetical protein